MRYEYAHVNGRIGKELDIAKVENFLERCLAHELPQFLAVINEHPLVRHDEREISVLFQQAIGSFHKEAVKVCGFVVATVISFAVNVAHLAHALELHIRRVSDDGVKACKAADLVEDFREFEHPFERIGKVDGVARRALVFLEHFNLPVFNHSALERCNLVPEHHLGALRLARFVFLHKLSVFNKAILEAIPFAVGSFITSKIVRDQASVLHGVFGEQRIADFDIDVDVRERLELFVAAFLGVVGVLQEFDPKA